MANFETCSGPPRDRYWKDNPPHSPFNRRDQEEWLIRQSKAFVDELWTRVEKAEKVALLLRHVFSGADDPVEELLRMHRRHEVLQAELDSLEDWLERVEGERRDQEIDDESHDADDSLVGRTVCAYGRLSLRLDATVLALERERARNRDLEARNVAIERSRKELRDVATDAAEDVRSLRARLTAREFGRESSATFRKRLSKSRRVRAVRRKARNRTKLERWLSLATVQVRDKLEAASCEVGALRKKAECDGKTRDMLVDRLHSATEEVRRQYVKITSTQARAELLERELCRARETNAEREREADDAQTQLKTTRLQLRSAQAELKTSRAQLDATKSELKTTATGLEACRAELKTSRLQLKTLDARLRSTQRELDSARTVSDDARAVERSQRELGNLRLEIQTLQVDWETAKRTVANLERQVQDLKTQNRKANAAQTALRTELTENHDKEVKAYKHNMVKLETDRNHWRDLAVSAHVECQTDAGKDHDRWNLLVVEHRADDLVVGVPESRGSRARKVIDTIETAQRKYPEVVDGTLRNALMHLLLTHGFRNGQLAVRLDAAVTAFERGSGKVYQFKLELTEDCEKGDTTHDSALLPSPPTPCNPFVTPSSPPVR